MSMKALPPSSQPVPGETRTETPSITTVSAPVAAPERTKVSEVSGEMSAEARKLGKQSQPGRPVSTGIGVGAAAMLRFNRDDTATVTLFDRAGKKTNVTVDKDTPDAMIERALATLNSSYDSIGPRGSTPTSNRKALEKELAFVGPDRPAIAVDRDDHRWSVLGYKDGMVTVRNPWSDTDSEPKQMKLDIFRRLFESIEV
jgi:hypothetical protein